MLSQFAIIFVIMNSKLIRRHPKAAERRAPAYSVRSIRAYRTESVFIENEKDGGLDGGV